MTNKQIIIDNVDVSECGGYYFSPTGFHSCQDIQQVNNLGYEQDTLCEQNPNCCYKKLKRKEQECEGLRGDLYFTNEQLKDFKSHYDKVVEECENLREKYLGLKEQKGSYIVQLNTVNEQLDQLKAENEQLKKQVESDKSLITNAGKQHYQLIQEYDGLKSENEELKKKYNIYTCGVCGNKEDCNKLYKTLTEIKEIAKDAIKNVSDRCIETTPMYGVHKQILQKISECEV